MTGHDTRSCARGAHDAAREAAEADTDAGESATPFAPGGAGRQNTRPGASVAAGSVGVGAFAPGLHADRAGEAEPAGVSRAKGGNGNGKHKTADADKTSAKEKEDTVVDAEHVRVIEALLFASAEPVGERALARYLPEGVKLKTVLEELQRLYAGRGINLVPAGKTWAFRTAPDLGARLKIEVEVARKPSRPAVETLAIVAYHQPVTRAEIEEIRGVQISRGTLDWLFERGWVRPGPRREVPGRPVTWLTTDAFLDHFGLASEKDLPGVEELAAAGLLDARPALNAYRARGELAGEDELVDTAPAETEEGAIPEPLDPDGGDASDDAAKKG
jgi:segregation and condensation protein B